MSHLLWKFYLEDDVDKFRRLLANAGHNTQHAPKSHGGGTIHSTSFGSAVGSPGGFATSPRTVIKHRKASGQTGNISGAKSSGTTLTRAELNSRDHSGLTVLHRAASSTSENAICFAIALIEHPAIDLYVQDTENGWTALHRALYFGNITIAREIINRDARDPVGTVGGIAVRAGSSVIKVKDHEGNSPFDVYNATIARRTLQHRRQTEKSEDGSQNDDTESLNIGPGAERGPNQFSIDGDELFAFGSNKNLTLGFGDGDDRQHPEKITLTRPPHLLFRFYQEYLDSVQGISEALHTQIRKGVPRSVSDLPSFIQNRPIVIQEVALSKLHSAILTTDPESNLYICGFGSGGRLGTGDETTRFNYACIEGGGLAGKKVVAVALGQSHTLALSSDGEVFSFGTNKFSQLGFTLPRPASKDEEPMCSTPRQIFGPLKREFVIGVATSAFHSVAHTSTSLYTWGKNEGQLGLMDSDSRSLETQPVPRKVAASLFKSPIVMVSAINRATTCLLANHTVCVFTNYGYNIVKFPLHEGFRNYHLQSKSLATRYEAESNHISSITSGGDTIAAVSSRGDLFTVNVSQKLDTNPTATSTTNPSKIKGSLSQPQRVWALRKGNWDGIKSVGVAENGSVIVCTQAGAVWRRVKRVKIKDAFAGTSDFNIKDFKFQRVPGLTKVAVVRSNTFGGYVAVRKDCDVTKTQILVDEQSLWQDIAPLLSIKDLEASKFLEDEMAETAAFWVPDPPKEHFDPLKRAVLISPDIEADVERHLLGLRLQDEGYDIEIYTTSSDTKIPAHGFMLAARSSVLRKALSEFRWSGSYIVPDVLVIERSSENMTKVTFQGVDFMTVLNLVIYMYTDTVVDLWHFTRHAPKMAFRYRQVRTELMRMAAHLKMNQLEAAVRLMTEPDRRMDVDLALAIQHPQFFEDGDAIVELEGGVEVAIHSDFVCKRCQFFDGLFNGRAGGQWLAGRRQEIGEMFSGLPKSLNPSHRFLSQEIKPRSVHTIRIDLKHIDPETFQLVLRYIYCDCGTELFDDIVSADIDEFCDIVMDVMGVANELMLDRLSQICQQVIGRFVNTRNVCQVLNAVAPCSVTKFKDAGLEYLCLQLESMLENHLLDDLDEDLLLELDEVVRGNQLNCLPFTKSGRAELQLHERHPELAREIVEGRTRQIRDIAFRTSLKDEDSRLSSSFRAHTGGLDDLMSGSPLQERTRMKSKATRSTPLSPTIRPRDSIADLMFDMDDVETLISEKPNSPMQTQFLDLKSSFRTGSAITKVGWDDTENQNALDRQHSSPPSRPVEIGLGEITATPNSNQKTWSSPVLPSSRLDMREIMAQASSNRTSTLSMSLSAQKLKDETVHKASAPKLSQRERKKQQQQQQQQGKQAVGNPQISLDKSLLGAKPVSPWRAPASGSKTSLKDVLNDESKLSPSALPLQSSPVPAQTLTPRRTASPDTRFAGQRRTVSGSPKTQVTTMLSSGPLRTASQSTSVKTASLIPHSKTYTASAAKAEPSLQLSMADIIGQQTREQEVIKEAVAKRSLQEIQEEQAFQEWWDKESKKAQEEEASKAKGIVAGSGRGGKSGGGRGTGGGRGRGDIGPGRGRGKGRGQEKRTSIEQ